MADYQMGGGHIGPHQYQWQWQDSMGQAFQPVPQYQPPPVPHTAIDPNMPPGSMGPSGGYGIYGGHQPEMPGYDGSQPDGFRYPYLPPDPSQQPPDPSQQQLGGGFGAGSMPPPYQPPPTPGQNGMVPPMPQNFPPGEQPYGGVPPMSDPASSFYGGADPNQAWRDQANYGIGEQNEGNVYGVPGGMYGGMEPPGGGAGGAPPAPPGGGTSPPPPGVEAGPVSYGGMDPNSMYHPTNWGGDRTGSAQLSRMPQYYRLPTAGMGPAQRGGGMRLGHDPHAMARENARRLQQSGRGINTGNVGGGMNPGGANLGAGAGAYQKAHDEAKAANEARYQELKSDYGAREGLAGTMEDRLKQNIHGYGERDKRIQGMIDQVGGEQRKDIDRGAQQLGARQTQQLQSRGLGNTTIRANVARGVEEDRRRSQERLSDQLLREKADYAERLSGDTMSAKDRYAQMGPQFAASLTGDTLGMMERRTDSYPSYDQMAQLYRMWGQGGFV